jgi:hypothetical protein
MCKLSILGEAKMRRKKESIKPPLKEFPYGFHMEFSTLSLRNLHMDSSMDFITPTTSSSVFVRILVHSQKLRVPATTH